MVGFYYFRAVHISEAVLSLSPCPSLTSLASPGPWWTLGSFLGFSMVLCLRNQTFAVGFSDLSHLSCGCEIDLLPLPINQLFCARVQVCLHTVNQAAPGNILAEVLS